jgi:hypothetical protein
MPEPFRPPRWRYEPQSTRRQRALSEFDAVRDQVSPLVASGDPVDVLRAQNIVRQAQAPAPTNDRLRQSITASLDRQQQTKRDEGGGGILGIIERPRQAALGFFTGDNPVDSIRQSVAGFLGRERFSGEDIGFVRQLPEGSRARQVAGAVGEEVLDPLNWGAAAAGNPGAVAALRASGRAGRVAAAVAEPVMRGGFATRLAGETAAALGARTGARLASDALPEDTPGVARAAVGLLGGVAGAGGVVGGLAALRSSTRAAADPVVARNISDSLRISGATGPLDPGAVLRRMPEGTEDGALRVAAESAQRADETLAPGVAETLEQTRRIIDADQPGAVAQVFYRIPGVRKRVRPGLDLPRNVLEAYVGEERAASVFRQQAFASRRPLYQQAQSLFGDEALTGGKIGVQYLGMGDELAYPGAGTLYDIVQRPDRYALSPEQREFIRAFDQRNEGLRLDAVEGYGAEIGRFDTGRGGYLPNIDRSEAQQAIEETLERSESAVMSGGRAKTRVFETGYDRWLSDRARASRGELAEAQVFVPETNVARLVEGMDGFKTRAASAQVFKAGLGGRTMTEVAEQVAPALVERRAGLRRQIDAVRGKVQRQVASVQRNDLLAERLQTQLSRVDDREAQLIGRRLRASGVVQVSTPDAYVSPLTGALDLPAEAALQRRIAAIEGTITRNADGAVLRNRANDAALRELGEAQALLDLRRALKEANGDPNLALRIIEDQAERLGVEQAARGDAGYRSTLRSQSRTAERRGFRSGYAQVGNEGGEFYAALNRRSEVLDTIIRAASPDPEEAVRLSGLDAVDAQLDELRRIDRALADAATGPAERAVAGSAREETLRAELARLADEYADVKRAYEAVNLRGWTLVPEAGHRYFPAEQAAQVRDLLKADANPILRALGEINATVLAGDLSPIVGQQGQVQWLSAPIQTSQALFRNLRAGLADGDLFRAFRADYLADEIARNPQSWSDFAFNTGITATPGSVPSELAGGWFRRLPGGAGAKFSEFNDAVFAATVQGQKRMYDDTVATLVKQGIAPDVAKAEAGRHVMSLVPTPSPRMAGLSRQQYAELRAPFTSLTFIQRPLQTIAEAGEGLAMKATGKQPTVQQTLALRHLGQMAATAASLAASTAALNAAASGRDPVQAALDAVNPSPNNGEFLTVTLPGGYRVPIGGPYRAAIRAMMPGPVQTDVGQVWLPFAGGWDYFRNRVSPALRRQVDVLRNKDFGGNAIMTRDFPLNVLQLIQYEAEGALPLSAAAVPEGIRTGASPGEIATEAAGGFLGANVRAPSGNDRLNAEAERMFGRGFYDLSPSEKQQVREARPDAWEQAVERGSEQRQRAERVQALYGEQQARDDELLLSGDITREDWQRERDRRRVELNARRDEIYGDSGTGGDPVLSRYFETIDQATDEATGRVNWEAVDEALATFSQADLDYIDANTGVRDSKLSRLYRTLSREYYDLPRYRGFTADEGRAIDALWQEARNIARSADEVDMNRALRRVMEGSDPEIVRGVRRRIRGELRVAPDRSRLVKGDPVYGLVTGSGRLTAAEVEAINRRLQ